MSFFDSILFPLKWVVAWVLYLFHAGLTAVGMPADGGLTWVLSIVGLVLLMRIILIPLFFKQIKASRGMQIMQPELQALQKKYKNRKDPASRQKMQEEMMALYRKHGTNPFSSCLPILAQSPIFFALFRVLYSLPDIAAGTYRDGEPLGPITADLANQFLSADVFGATLASSFMGDDATINVRIVTAVMILLMSATTFTTQRQLTMKNMPATALDNPMARQQRMIMYAMPLIFLFSGAVFPLGVLFYWLTTNLWSMGQQFYTIRKMPAPGSEAEANYEARQRAKLERTAARRGVPVEELLPEPEKPSEPEQPRGQREQPVRKDRQRRPSGSGQPGGSSRPEGAGSPQERAAQRHAQRAAQRAAQREAEAKKRPRND